MLENILMAASNLYGFRATDATHNIVDRMTITCAMISSIVYHLFEKSKHGMSGVSSQMDDKVWLDADRVYAVALVARLLIFHGHKIDRHILAIGAISVTAMAISECQNVIDISAIPVGITRAVYMVTHTIWHIGAFHIAYLMVK
jgi:hypothetical protein